MTDPNDDRRPPTRGSGDPEIINAANDQIRFDGTAGPADVATHGQVPWPERILAEADAWAAEQAKPDPFAELFGIMRETTAEMDAQAERDELEEMADRVELEEALAYVHALAAGTFRHHSWEWST